jgi:arylsulfatase A-like enzyme
MKPRSPFTGFIAVTAVMSLLSGLRAAEADAKKPNIVIIIVDDLGWRDLSYMGSPFYEAPAIDKLAAEGMAFNRAYAAAPPCVQSRYSIITGKSHSRSELRGERGLAVDQETIGTSFQEGGYTTFYAGKWHLGGEDTYWPMNRCFDFDVGSCALGKHVWAYYQPGTPSDIGLRESHKVAPYGLESGQPITPSYLISLHGLTEVPTSRG